jgi:methyl-accepting chemotaxis protein
LINAIEKMDKAAGTVKKVESQSDDIRKILDKLDNLSSKINAIQKNNAETKGN